MVTNKISTTKRHYAEKFDTLNNVRETWSIGLRPDNVESSRLSARKLVRNNKTYGARTQKEVWRDYRQAGKSERRRRAHQARNCGISAGSDWLSVQ